MALGGSRPGAGRKSKAEEFGLTEKMDSIGKTDDVLQRIYGLAIGTQSLQNPNGTPPNLDAAKLWLSYRLGKPQDHIDITSGGESIVIKFTDAQ